MIESFVFCHFWIDRIITDRLFVKKIALYRVHTTAHFKPNLAGVASISLLSFAIYDRNGARSVPAGPSPANPRLIGQQISEIETISHYPVSARFRSPE